MTLQPASAGPSLDWYLTRSTGAVALILLTAAIAAGVVDVERWSTPRWPRFRVDSVHRNVSLLAMAFLVLHILTSVLDSFAPIALTDSVIPFIGSYRPIWLGLGAVSFDLLIAVTVTSLVRRRIGFGTWRAVHWLTYASWPVALLHSFGSGSDVKSAWLLVLSIGCLLVVLAAMLARVISGWPATSAAAALRSAAPVPSRCSSSCGCRAVRWAANGHAARVRRRRCCPTARPQRGRVGERVDAATPGLGGAVGGGPAPLGLPRLLSGIPDQGSMTLGEHAEVHGALPARARRGRRGGRERADALIEEIAAAGLLGRGGAGFPTATKMRAVAGGRGRPIVVANGAEGEPASLKDHTLLELLPHLVLDGAILAAEAVGADEVVIAACEYAGASVEGVSLAIAEREAAAGPEIPALRLVILPGHYVAGEESALVNFLGGGPAKPLFTPPRPFERGVNRRPTLVNNVETLAHIALIARHGAAWFRQLGTPTQPGSALVTLSGPVAHPGVYEIEHGASLASLIEAGGGATARLRGALLGGYAGSWIGAERLHGLGLSNEHLAPHGATLGAGVVLLLSEEACPVAETARLARWLAEQSTGQCGPCVHGLDALALTLEQIAAGVTEGRATERVDRLASLVSRRGACSHPDGTANLILSALEAFPSEFAEHARRGPCQGCAAAGELPLPLRLVSDETLRHRVRT